MFGTINIYQNFDRRNKMTKKSKILPLILFVLLLSVKVESWCLKATFADSSQITSLDFSNDGSMILSASKSQRVVVWDAHTLNQSYIYNFASTPLTAKFSKDNKLIAIGGTQDSITFINILGGTSNTQPSGLSQVNEVDWSKDGRFISCGTNAILNANEFNVGSLSYSNHNTTTLPAGTPTLCCRHLPTSSSPSYKVAYGLNNGVGYTQNYGYCCAAGGNISVSWVDSFLWDNPTGTPSTRSSGAPTPASTKPRYAVDWNIQTSQAYFVGNDNNLQILNASGASDRIITVGVSLNTVSVAKDSTYAAVGGVGGNVFMYNVVTKNSQFNELNLTDSVGTDITASVFSPDSQYLVTGNKAGTMFLYKRVCSACPVGTYPNASDCQPCNTAIPGCYNCDNSTWCYACSNGYYVYQNNGKSLCGLCILKINGCNQCSNSSVCISCVQGFYLSSGSNPVCNTCWSSNHGCLMCNSSTTCQQCDFRYYLNVSSCASCSVITNCLSCNSTTYCMQCVQGFYENGSGGCTQCPQNCTYCINSSICTQCDNSFYLTTTNQCALCTVAGCLNCNSTNYCFDCLETMWANSGTCTFCTPPCLDCTSATSCVSCIVGYYLSGTTCLSCTVMEGCVGCSSGTTCVACSQGYYLNAGSCSLCNTTTPNCAQCTSSTCTFCRIGFYLTTTPTLSCTICSVGCLTCLTSSTCLSCQIGYYYTQSNYSCTICPFQCSACLSATICLSCNPKYYYNATNQNCTICAVTNCITCKSSSVCLTCGQGYFLDNSGALCRSCSNNITNCLDCYNSTYCKSCQLGYYLVATNTSCTACVFPCSTCDLTGCLTCQLGYYLDSTTTPVSCAHCEKECLQCVTANNCTKCVPGYYYDSLTATCISCEIVQFGCSTCNKTQCFECKLQRGYFLNSINNICQLCSSPMPNCINCLTQSNCVLCKYGYLPTSSNTTCTLCSSILPNCQNCLNSSKCQTCISGFYVTSTGTCLQCINGCFSCNNSATCQICLPLYVIETNYSCSLCENKLIGCEMCSYNPTIQCNKCVVGYYLTANTCTLCSSVIAGCSICTDSTNCATCSSGYYHDPTNTCFLCSSVITNCQLCQYNSISSSVDCLDCNAGYFLNSTFACQSCTDIGCLTCSDSVTCTLCQTGYYLSTGDCLECQNLSPGCRLCNSSQCLQCNSGFYLGGSNTCLPCSIQGCQLCSQLNPTTTCLSCNSQYYLTSTQTCQLCKTPLPNCLQCSNSSTCQQCDSGYYISPSSTCNLCSNKFVGCTLCTPSVCLQCESGYLLDSVTNLCELCNIYIPGCSFCLSESTCVSCESGYYALNNTCIMCSNITGCIQCTNATQCLFCDYGYYLLAGACHLCNQSIKNCIACTSPVMCTACLGNFIISNNQCVQLKGQSFPDYPQIKLITEYVSPTQLKTRLMSIGKKIMQVGLNWTQETQLYIVDENYQQHQLQIKRYEFDPAGYSLVFYTDNPLTNMTDLSGLNGMPLLSPSANYTSSRLLQSDIISPHSSDNTPSHTPRLLQGYSMSNRFKTQIQMSQVGINSLFPDIHQSGTFYMKYSLNQPQFYKSVIDQHTFYYHYFGITICVVLIIMYLLKIMYFAPQADDKGQIMPHILCYKMMAMILYPLYGEYIDYCQGFMILDLPWLNDYLSQALTINTDVSPQTYKLFYININLPSTYLFALIIDVVVVGMVFGVLKYVMKKEKVWGNIREFFYNLLICGVTVGSFLCLLGAYYNPVNTITLDSFFYILGISIFVAIVLQSLYSIYRSINQTLIPFHKPRIIIKCVGLSMAYINPLYIFLSMIFLDLCLMIIEYIIKREKKVMPKLWLFNNILVDVGLALMMLGPYSLVSVFVASACIIAVIGIDGFIMIKENAEMKELRNVKLKENQLIKTMEAIEKENFSTREKNHQIYFKNKILEDFQAAENITQDEIKFNATNYFGTTFNQSQGLFFEQHREEAKPEFDTVPIYEENSQHLDDHLQETKKPSSVALRRRAGNKLSPLRHRKKMEKKEWTLQTEQHPDTFVLGDFQ